MIAFFINVSSPYTSQSFFYLLDKSYGLHTVSYCLTNENPDSAKNCTFKDIKAYNTKNSGIEKEYFYKADINRFPKTKQYVIVKYSGSYISGSMLYAMSWYNDVYDFFYKDLNILNDIYIAIGSIIILSILLYVIFYYLRQKTVVDNIQKPANISTPSYPLVG